MKPKPTQQTPQRDVFKPELRDIIDPRHELVQLSQHIDWEACEAEFTELYADLGRPGASIRLLVGLSLLKHTYALSDEVVVQRWVENPYFQHFCGEQYFQHELPLNPTTLGRFRRRLGESGMKRLLALTIQAGISTGTIQSDSLKTVAVDTTVMEKAVAHPNDGQLLKRAQEHLMKMAHALGVKLRQSYEKELKKLQVKVGRYAHAKQFKRMRKTLKIMATRVGQFGDRVHAVLCGVGQNQRMILRKLRAILFCLILLLGQNAEKVIRKLNAAIKLMIESRPSALNASA